MNKSELDTPFVLIDLDKMESNITRMQERANLMKVGLRPHVKTHKIPQLAKRQTDVGAVGITVAKLGEAAVMAAEGQRDILIAYPIVGEKKIDRLLKLLAAYPALRLTIALDSFEAADRLSLAAVRAGHIIRIALEIDTGFGRVGLPAGEPIIALAERVRPLAGVEVIGVISFSGESYLESTPAGFRSVANREAEQAAYTAALLRERGFRIDLVSVGSTPSATFGDSFNGVTELRAGTYIFGDLTMIALGTCTLNDCALTVKVTIVSRPSEDRAVVDGGTKIFTSDGDSSPIDTGRGFVVGHPGIVVSRFNEEHGMLRLPPEDGKLAVGDTLEVVPVHCCAVMNMIDEVALVRGEGIEAIVPVAARGKIR